jgi:hypothetical protein
MHLTGIPARYCWRYRPLLPLRRLIRVETDLFVPPLMLGSMVLTGWMVAELIAPLLSKRPSIAAQLGRFADGY